jgi:hypothetical protein
MIDALFGDATMRVNCREDTAPLATKEKEGKGPSFEMSDLVTSI